MHREVRYARQHQLLDLFDEDPLATERCNGDVGALIAGGLGRDEGNREAGHAGHERVGHGVGLEQGEG